MKNSHRNSYVTLFTFVANAGQKHTFISCQFNKCSFNLYVLIFAWVLGCKFPHQDEFWSPHSSKKMFSLTCISFITLRIWQGTNGGLGNLIIVFIFQSFVLSCNRFHWIPTIHFWYFLAHSRQINNHNLYYIFIILLNSQSISFYIAFSYNISR